MMRIGELSERTDVGVSTLRAWERRYGLLQPRRSAAGHRLYGEDDVERINTVTRLLAEGMTLRAAIGRVETMGPGALPDGEGAELVFAQVLELANQGVWVVREGRTRYANRRLAEIMGLSVEALLAIDVLEFFDPEELSLVRDRTQQVRAGQPVRFTQRLRRGDGSWFLAEIDTTPIFDQHGRYDGAVCLVDDVTAQAESELLSRLHSTLLDVIDEAVVAASVDGQIVYLNAAAEGLFGWTAAEVVGQHRPHTFGLRDEVTTGSGPQHRLVERRDLIRRDGSTFTGRVTSSPLVAEDGTVLGLAGVIADATSS